MTLKLTPHIVAYLGSEEGLVPEAYKDSKGVWTWAMGLATTGGYDVLKYKDKPAPLDVCLIKSIDAMRAKYLPIVDKAFPKLILTENQIAAALSFAYRHGHLNAQWVTDFNRGDRSSAFKNYLNWTDHGRQVPRATRERDLFFEGKWPSLLIPVYTVSHTTYKPLKGTPKDLMPLLQQILGGR